MFSITETYTDYNGVEKTETFWFNLSQRELAKFALGPSGGLDAVLAEIVSTNDTGRAMDLLEEIVLSAYGKRMPDGRFAKVDENGRRYADHFKETQVYDSLFMGLFLDPEKLIAFVNGVVPDGLKASVEAASSDAKAKIAELEKNTVATPLSVVE